MFDQLKKLQQLKSIQDSLKKEKSAVEKNGVRVVMNGGLELEELKLNPALAIEEQEKLLLECLNEAKHAVEKIAAKTMMQSGMGGLF